MSSCQKHVQTCEVQNGANSNFQWGGNGCSRIWECSLAQQQTSSELGWPPYPLLDAYSIVERNDSSKFSNKSWYGTPHSTCTHPKHCLSIIIGI